MQQRTYSAVRKKLIIINKSAYKNISNYSNSLKDIKYSLNCFNVTEYFFRIFELTNQRRGRENSKFKNGPTLDQICSRLGPNNQNLTSVFPFICPRDYFLSEIGKSEGVSKGLTLGQLRREGKLICKGEVKEICLTIIDQGQSTFFPNRLHSVKNRVGGEKRKTIESFYGQGVMKCTD